MRVVLMRHGQTDSNLVGRYAGPSGEALTHAGRIQVLRAIPVLRQLGVTRIVSSPLARARESAQIIGERLELPLVIDERLTELVMGPWQGLTEAEIAVRDPTHHQIWLTHPAELLLEGRETLRALATRVERAIHEHGSEPLPLLMTHVAPIRVAILLTIGQAMAFYKRIPVDNGEVFCLDLAKREAARFELGPDPDSTAGMRTRPIDPSLLLG